MTLLLALIAALSPTADTAFPSSAALQDALNDLEKCRGLAGAECSSPIRQYKVHGAKCMAIAPEEGRRTVACRVDFTLTYADPEHETTRYRDTCLRFMR